MMKQQYRFWHPEEVYDLSVEISAYFPRPMQFQCGVYELLFNAIEHGNLGIGAGLKEILLKEQRWEKEIERRLSDPVHRKKTAEVCVSRNDQGTFLLIRDQGRGFDWKSYTCSAALNHRKFSGRGLYIAKKCGFDPLAYNEAGNEVSCFLRDACLNSLAAEELGVFSEKEILNFC